MSDYGLLERRKYYVSSEMRTWRRWTKTDEGIGRDRGVGKRKKRGDGHDS